MNNFLQLVKRVGVKVGYLALVVFLDQTAAQELAADSALLSALLRTMFVLMQKVRVEHEETR